MSGFSAEERQLLHDSMSEFFRNRYGVERAMTLARDAEPCGFGRAEWASYAELGWLGLTIPEDAGGSGGGLTEAAILFAAAGRCLAQEPLAPTLMLGAGAIRRMGSPEQRRRLAEIASGKQILAFLHAEPEAGYARDHVTSVAAPDGNGYALSGVKSFALGAHAADTLVVSARIGAADGPVGLFLVARDATGVSLAPAPALDGRRGATATFDGVRLDANALLGGARDDRLADIDALLDHATLAVCADAVGAMTAAAEMTTEYVKGRQQFGRPLAEFQVLQHRLVDMRIQCEEARAVVHAALTAIDQNRGDRAVTVARAKVKVARAARFVGAQGIQLHGGMGMTDEMPIGHYYKRLAVFEALYGDAEWHLARLAAREAASAPGADARTEG